MSEENPIPLPSAELTPEPVEPPKPEDVPGTDDADASVHSNHRKLKFTLRMLLFGFLFLFLIRVFVLEPYRIPTLSMSPTLMQGDVVLVCKLPYIIRSLRTIPILGTPIPFIEIPGLGHLEHGDVIVFDPPLSMMKIRPDEKDPLVKRCLAVAGDTVQLVDGRIDVNGKEVPPQGDATRVWDRCSPMDPSIACDVLRDGAPVQVPYKGMHIELDSTAYARWRWLFEEEHATVSFRNRIVFINGLPASQYTVQEDYLLALGDNSGGSYDSRFFGFVPYRNLIGQAIFIYWSRRPEGEIRWDRLGKAVR